MTSAELERGEVVVDNSTGDLHAHGFTWSGDVSLEEKQRAVFMIAVQAGIVRPHLTLGEFKAVNRIVIHERALDTDPRELHDGPPDADAP